MLQIFETIHSLRIVAFCKRLVVIESDCEGTLHGYRLLLLLFINTLFILDKKYNKIVTW